MKNKLLILFAFFITLGMVSSCSDFRKAVGKEKVIPDEFSIAVTPSLLIPPGFKIDAQALKNNEQAKGEKDFNIRTLININENKDINSFSEFFTSQNIPKDIRRIVDEETLGISLSERRGIDILFGNKPKTGVLIDPKKEALRIRKDKSSDQTINSNPTPAININSRKPLLIKW